LLAWIDRNHRLPRLGDSSRLRAFVVKRAPNAPRRREESSVSNGKVCASLPGVGGLEMFALG
jgi:hypothetical protein